MSEFSLNFSANVFGSEITLFSSSSRNWMLVDGLPPVILLIFSIPASLELDLLSMRCIILRISSCFFGHSAKLRSEFFEFY